MEQLNAFPSELLRATAIGVARERTDSVWRGGAVFAGREELVDDGDTLTTGGSNDKDEFSGRCHVRGLLGWAFELTVGED